MILSPETRQSPSTVLLEHELDSTEGILHDSLANATRVSGSSDYANIRRFIAYLKTKNKNYEVANHALVTRRRQTSHVHEAEQLVWSRLDTLHRDSYQAVKLLNSRLVTLGHEQCSSFNVSNTSEDRFARDTKNLVKKSGSLAGADLTEKSIKVPKELRR